MDIAALESYQASPISMAVIVVASLLFGAALLMLVVRWTEGFAISFWVSLKMTGLAVVAALVSEVAIFAALYLFGFVGMAAYWWALAITAVLSTIAYTVIYAYGVKRPTGERIGIAQAIKVTLIQLALSVAIIVAIAIVIAILIANGVVKMPELPPGVLPR